MGVLLQDVRYGIRMLGKNPGFTAVAVLTLALGIGANTAIFSVMNAALVRRLPVPNPEQLVRLHTTDQPPNTSQTGYNDTSLTEPVFEELRKQHDVLSDVIAYVPLSFRKAAVRFGAEPEEANADMVSGNFFSGLGVRLERGRGFTSEDESQHTQTAVLGYAYWTRRFARNPSVLGQTLYIKGVPFTVIGVAPREFGGVGQADPTDIWVPFQTRADLKPWGRSPDSSDSLYGDPTWLFLLMIGRLQPGISQERALAQLNPVYQRTLAATGVKPDPKAPPVKLFFSPVRGIENLRENYEKPLLVLMAMVGVVLVIACGNVAMLLVARNTARRREFSLRLALGATRLQMFRQLLTESLVLVGAGTALGWLFATWATEAMVAWAGFDFNVSPDQRVLAFTLALSGLAALLFGLAPLRNAVRSSPGFTRTTGAPGSARGKQQQRRGQAVVAFQIALCLALLVCASLLLRTLRNLETLDLGLRTQGLLVFGITPPQGLSKEAEVLHFYQSLMERLRALPGVESATLMDNRIGSGWSNNTGAFVDGKPPKPNTFCMMRWNAVGPDYFHVLKTPILVGRDFTDADSGSAPKVAIINRTFAERYLAGSQPLGHHVANDNGPKPEQYTVVGVVQDSKYTGVEEEARPMAWFPYTQVGGTSTMNIELRTEGYPTALLPEVRRAVAEFGPDLPLLEPMTQQEQFERSYTDERLSARLAICFGFLAALLVATGLYGTLAYRVSRRTAEIGVRMALGAQRRQVLWMVLRESLAVSVAGLLFGLPLAVVGARVLRFMLFGLGPGDPLAFAAAILGLAIVVLAASLIPAQRAAKVDPMVALRYE
ncbi:Permease [Acidobacteriia bacterium SbA2]|nr:Permease [Acidobacteriia bacterium SbA2]